MKLKGYDSVSSWTIAAACSFVTCMAVVPVKVCGMLFVAFPSRYNTDRQSASMFVVIQGLVASCSGPLIGYLGEIFALRNLVVLGCLFTSLGIGICYFAESIVTVTISIGFFCGIGMGLQLFLLPQILKQHFAKNLSSAYGVVWMGSCAGYFAVIPIFETLLDIYGVSGALLLACGMMLHSVPVSMLLRDPKYQKTPISLCDKQPNEKEQITLQKSQKEENANFIHSDYCEETLANNPSKNDNETYLGDKACVTLKAYTIEENVFRDTYQNTTSCHEPPKEGNIHPPANTQFQSSIDLKCNIDIGREQTISKETTYGSFSDDSLTTNNRNKYLNAFKAWNILTNPPFLVIMLCQSGSTYIDIFVSTIILDISRDKGFPQSQEQFFLMLYSAGQIVGYTCLGWVTDKGYLSSARFQAIGSLCMGLTCYGFIFSNSVSAMMVAVLCFAICVSVYTSGGPTLVYEYIEETKQSMAIASRNVLTGPLGFTMGPTIGYFRGTLGSYDGILYLLGAFSVTCAVFLLLLPCLARCTNKTK